MNLEAKTIFLVILMLLILSCENSKEESSAKNEVEQAKKEISFSSTLWKDKKEDAYPNRPLMYRKILYSDSVRTLSKKEVIKMLWKPDREESNHYYYLIERSEIGSWTLNQKSMVVKFKNDTTVEWIKMHE